MYTRKKTVKIHSFLLSSRKLDHPYISHQQCDDPLVSSQKALENCWGCVLCSAFPQAEWGNFLPQCSGGAKKGAVLLGWWC